MKPRPIATDPRRAIALLLAGACALGAARLPAAPSPGPALVTASDADPLTRTITGADAARWLEAPSATRVFGKTWYIGSKRLRQAVIDTGSGLILIDAGLPEGFVTLKTQLAALGLDPAGIRYVLVTEPHYDHGGAVAALVRETGARVYASPGTARALRRGMSGHDDPQYSSLIAYPPVRKVRVLRDGDRVRLGRTMITAHAMPGHTPGSLGFSWQDCEGTNCRSIVFGASLNPLGTGTYRYAGNPALSAALAATLARLEAMPCDILLTGHPEHSGADARMSAALAGTADAFFDPGACRAMAEKYRGVLEQALKR